MYACLWRKFLISDDQSPKYLVLPSEMSSSVQDLISEISSLLDDSESTDENLAKFKKPNHKSSWVWAHSVKIHDNYFEIRKLLGV